MQPIQEKKDTYLNEALKLAPFEGWNDRLFDLIERNCNITPGYYKILFERGAVDLLNYYIDQIDNELIEQSKLLNLREMRVRDRVFTVTKLRLELIAKHKKAVARALNVYVLPRNLADTKKQSWKTADLIWNICFDDSTDFNYYTKRFLLSGVYASTLLFFVNDKSKNSEESWAFLARQIDRVLQIGKVKSNCKKLMSRVPFLREFVY